MKFLDHMKAFTDPAVTFVKNCIPNILDYRFKWYNYSYQPHSIFVISIFSSDEKEMLFFQSINVSLCPVQRFPLATIPSWLSSVRIIMWGLSLWDQRRPWLQVCDVPSHRLLPLDLFLFFPWTTRFILQELWMTWRQLEFRVLGRHPRRRNLRPAKVGQRPSWSVTAFRQPVTAPSLTPRRLATSSARQFTHKLPLSEDPFLIFVEWCHYGLKLF